HLLCAAEVGTDLLGGPAPTARLRGSGTGPLLGPEGTLPAAGRRGQHHRGRAVHPGELLPPAAASGVPAPPPSVGGVHPEAAAPAAGRDVNGGGLHLRHLPTGD